ncbi:MAG: glycosyltransferase, partial [Candidatus Zophobacter franzmannii]|nr:glycosyltransferase [Candidatus Zophobacter franzmannii]
SSLSAIDYPTEKYEVLLVDDASIDSTVEKIEAYLPKNRNIQLLKLTEKSTEYLGKKAALKLGSETAKNEILLFTDADIAVPSRWLRSMNNYYTPETGMVIGYVRKKILPWMSRFKRIVSVGTFASTAGLGKPFSCSGGNLSIRKETFEEIGGYESIKHLIAGDDKMLLSLVNKTGWEVAYNADVKVLECSRPDTLTAFINREKRQLGKFKMSSPLYMLFSLMVLAFFIWLPVNLIVTRSIWVLIPYSVGMLLFYSASCVRHKEIFNPFDIILFFVLPYYMLFFSVWGTFSSFKWKD